MSAVAFGRAASRAGTAAGVGGWDQATVGGGVLVVNTRQKNFVSDNKGKC